MAQNDWLAERFQENRPHLRSVAARILGSSGEAEDAVQETWMRLTRAGADKIENLGGWLTTVVARVCLDMLRSRKVRKEGPLDEGLLEKPDGPRPAGPDEEALMADSLGSALLMVLGTLTPAERVAFVLHDLFDLSFAEVAPILGRSETAARQLASRARRQVRGGPEGREDGAKKREVVAAFLKASREGDLAALLRVLDPDIRLYADDKAVKTAQANKDKGAPPFEAEMRGAEAVAEAFQGKAQGLEPCWVNGSTGASWFMGGKPRVAFLFLVKEGRIQGIEVVMDPADLEEMAIEVSGKQSQGGS